MAAPYIQRHVGGFLDGEGLTAVDAAFLNAVESALLQLLGEAPSADEVGVWVGGAGGAMVYQKITNAQISAAAAIDKSKLGPLNIVDADIAGGAAIAKSKLASLGIVNADIASGAAIALSKLEFTPMVPQDPVTSLPGSPLDNQQAILTDSVSAPTYTWLMQYDASISDAYKWRYLGGVPHRGALSLTIPRAGFYWLEIGSLGRSFSATQQVIQTLTAGGISLVANAGGSGGGTQGTYGSLYDADRTTSALTASQVLTVSDSGNVAAVRPYIRATPVRVS